MKSIKWIKIFFSLILITTIFIGAINYIVDPYGIYNMNVFKNKPKQSNKIKLVKAIKVKEIKPASIVLGTSRAEYGYDPTHEYFIKPSYNLATSGSSVYENKLYLKWALKQGNLKKVLLVADYIMFNNKTQRSVDDFETYFNDKNIYSLLFSLDVFKDSYKTVFNNKKLSEYLQNGQKDHNNSWSDILKNGGHLEKMKRDESKYYKNYLTNYEYQDTKKESFQDFEEILKLCYENNIELDIVFGPSHIRQWEALNYYLNINKWFEWKRDIIFFVDKIGKQYNKESFRIMDFSVYHFLTSEIVPINKNIQMKYYWEGSHYKNELGLIVLDRLTGNDKYKDFGVQLNIKNIDEYLEQQKIDRYKFINTEKYRIDFEEYLKINNKLVKD